MIALSLIPSMAIFGMGIAAGEFALAGNGALLWSIDAVCVALAGGALFLLKRLLQRSGTS